MLRAGRPVRRAGACVPVSTPPAKSGTTAGMRVVVTRADDSACDRRNSHERYTPGNAGAAAADASGYPAGPATAPSGDAQPAAVVRCRTGPPGGAAPGRVRLHLQLLVGAGLDHTHPRNLRALRLLPTRPPNARPQRTPA